MKTVLEHLQEIEGVLTELAVEVQEKRDAEIRRLALSEAADWVRRNFCQSADRAYAAAITANGVLSLRDKKGVEK